MIKNILVLVVGLILSSEACAAIQAGQRIDDSKETRTIDRLQKEQNRSSEIESAIGTVNQALERALWEIETKRLAVENERRRLDALIAEVKRIDDSVKESEKGFDELIDQVSWGSNITTNILGTVLAIAGVFFALAFTGGIYGLYKGVYNALQSRLEEQHIKLTQEAKFKVLTGTYFQLTTAYYEQYRWLFGYEKKPEYVSAVQLAIYFAELGMENIKGIPDDYPGKQDLLSKLEHASFYHKAALPKELRAPHAKAALEFALEKLPAIVQKYRQSNVADWYYAEETRCWLLVRFGNTEQQEQAKAALKEILGNESIPKERRNEIRMNYDQIGILFE